MTWRTGQPHHPGEYLAVDTWLKREVARWHPQHGWCVRGKWVGHDGVLCWTDDLPEIPAHLQRERW